MAPENAERVILACCVLHHYLRMENTVAYTPPGFADSADPDENIVEGSWRQVDAVLDNIQQTSQRNPTTSAIEVREQFIHYLSNAGHLGWQDQHIYRV